MRASVPSPDPAEALRPPLKWAGGMRWQVPRVVALYRKLGFRRRFLEAPRMIGCTGARTPTLQLLATRNL